MWLVLCSISTILLGFVDIIKKKSSNDQPYRFIIIGLTLYNLFNLIIAIIYNTSYISNFNILNCVRVLPFSILTSLAYYCSVKAFANGDISRISPILKSRTVFILLLSAIFLKETLSVYQVIFIFLILLLNILLTKQKEYKEGNNNIKGILYAVGYLIFNGTAAFLNKIYVMNFSSPLEVSFYTGLVELVLILVLLTSIKKIDYLNIKKFKNYKFCILMEVLEVTIATLNRFSLLTGKLSIVTAITSCSIIISVITSTIVFKEKITIKKWLIILALISCIAILSVSSL